MYNSVFSRGFDIKMHIFSIKLLYILFYLNLERDECNLGWPDAGTKDPGRGRQDRHHHQQDLVRQQQPLLPSPRLYPADRDQNRKEVDAVQGKPWNF